MNNRDVGAASALALLLAGFSIAGCLSPSALTWGFHALGFLPPVWLAGYCAAAALVVVAARKGWLAPLGAILVRFMETTPYQFLVAVIGAGILAAVVFRVQAPLLGDGFFLVRNFADALHGTAPVLYRNEPLGTAWYYGVVSLFQPTTYAGFLNAFLFAGIVLGAGFVICVFFIVRELFSAPAERLAVFLLLLVAPYSQLYLGYVETYGAVLFALALFVLAAVRALRGRGSFLLVPPAFLLMVAVHYLTLLLLPALLLCGYAAWKAGRKSRVVLGFGIAALAAIGCWALPGFDLTKFSTSVPHSHLLPVIPSMDPDEIISTPYTLLSPYHGVDLLNAALLLYAPAAILLVLAARRMRETLRASVEARFLLAAVVPALLFLVVVKFDLGAAKDWDVTAPYAFAAVLLASVVWFRTPGTARRTAFAVVGGICLLNTLAYVKLNSTTDESVRRAETLLDRRNLSNVSYYASTLHLALYYHQVQDSAGPLRLWERYIAAFPQDARGYQNIIANVEHAGPASYGRVSRAYEGWLAVNPGDTTARRAYAKFCLDAGNEKYGAGAVADAQIFYEKTIALDPTLERAYNNLGSVYAQEDSLQKAIDCFEAAIELDSLYSDPYYNLGSAYEDRGERAKGLSFKKAAARLGNAAAQTALRQKGISW